jgi:hypothetical protein
MANQYRDKAAELWAQAADEKNPTVCAELETIILSYLRLAAHAARREANDNSYRAMMMDATEQKQPA